MKKLAMFFAAAALLSSTGVFAGPPAKDKKPAKTTKKVAKATDLWICPMTGEAIKDHSKAVGKPVVVSNRIVHFCCGGCPETFAKLSKKDQAAKVADAAKKETPKKG